MFRRAIKEINASYPAEDRELDNIKRIVRENSLAAGLASRDVHALQLVVEEVASNIIRHAYKYERGQIRFRMVIYDKQLVISLIDNGRSYQPNFSGTIDLDRLIETARKGGLGFYMVQKIMDSVEYISAGGYNEMRMIKRFKTAPDKIGALGRMMPLRAKFSFWTFMILASIIGVSYYFINHDTTRRLYANLDDKVTALTTTIADQAAGYMINRRSDVEFDELIVSYLRANPELKLIVIADSTQIVLAHSEDIKNIRKPFIRPESALEAKAGTLKGSLRHTPDLNFMSVPIKAGQRPIGTVFLSYSTAHIAQQLTDARVSIVRLTLILLLFGTLGIYLLSNYFVEPIVRITRRVRRFVSGDLESELPLEGADEFFEISKALNQLITRIHQERKNEVDRERIAKEIEVASQIQKTLLPDKISSLPGLELDAFYKAASRVGGDLYDAINIGQGKYCLVVGDVSGKGIPASMVMSMLRTAIRIYSEDASTAREILLKVNSYIHDNIPPGIFITIFLILYESNSRKITAVSAGHNPMLLIKSDRGRIERINPSGMPLGLPETSTDSFAENLQEVEMTLKTGDVLMVYTDGLTETVSADGQQYGVERLEELLHQSVVESNGTAISELSSVVVDSLRDFSGEKDFKDDLTFILGRCVAAVEDSDSSPELESAGVKGGEIDGAS